MIRETTRLFGSPWVWLARFRYRCGYGVHSPFAFAFITGVVYEKGTYYDYRRLDNLHGAYTRVLGLRPRKCARLLFRLANYAHPAVLVAWEASPTVQAYLASGCRSARFVALEGPDAGDAARSAVGEARPLLLYLEGRPGAEAVFRQLRPCLTPGSMLVLVGIHRRTACRTLWRRLLAEDAVGATFDLYDYGVVFFDRRRNRQHYIVNF